MKQAIPTSRNIWFDLFRFVLVYFVVSIHYNGGSPYAPLFRLAVPMFFMMSGFFIYTEDKTKREGKAINFIKNSFQYLLAATIIYVCYDVVKLIVNNGDVINYLGHRYYTDFVKGFIIQNRPLTSGYHLWFLIAFFLCSVIHYLFTKFELCDLYIFIVPIALMISMCCGGYLKAIYHYPLSLSYTRNAFYMGFPMFALGYILGKLKFTEFKPWQTLLLGMGAVGSLFFSRVESRVMGMEFYASSVISAALFILFFNNIRIRPNKLTKFYYKWVGSKCAFYMYIFHIAVERSFNIVAPTAALRCVYICLISFAIYEFFHLLFMLIKFIVRRIKRTNSTIKTAV